MKNMASQTIIISGLSGAGKSTALKTFEDMGYYCIDNLPLLLFSDLLQKKDRIQEQLAIVMDGRDRSFFSSWPTILGDFLQDDSFDLKTLFLEASDSVLLRRFNQLRRPHIMAGSGSIRQGIETEKNQFTSLREQADRIIDTSLLTSWDLRSRLLEMYGGAPESLMQVHLISFGFKNGVPEEADMVWDVRFLPNPYYVAALKELNGLDEGVALFVNENETTQKFLDLVKPLLSFLLPEFDQEGKANLTIGIGCTGGKHRSVVIARELDQILSDRNISLTLTHRDIDRE